MFNYVVKLYSTVVGNCPTQHKGLYSLCGEHWLFTNQPKKKKNQYSIPLKKRTAISAFRETFLIMETFSISTKNNKGIVHL